MYDHHDVALDSDHEPDTPALPSDEPPASLAGVSDGENAVAPPPLAVGTAIHVRLCDIDVEDATFRFRVELRSEGLRDTLQNDGQQMPVVLRPLPGGRYQIIAGHRRVAAARALEWPALVAWVREDLDDDDAAVRAALLENMGRKGYSDIDRAAAVVSCKANGQPMASIARMLGVTRQRASVLAWLTTLPPKAQAAIDDPDSGFTTAHALTLRDEERRVGGLDWPMWIERCRGEQLSVSALRRALRGSRPSAAGSYTSVLRADRTDLAAGVVQLRAARVDLGQLGTDEIRAFRDDLAAMLAMAEAALATGERDPDPPS